MKIFQIFKNMCYYDATPIHPTLADTIGKYPPDVLFVEAPDYVFESWGFDESKEGDERFIQPTPPEGWYYDAETGTFAPINPLPELEVVPEEPEPEPEVQDPETVTTDILTAAYNEGVNSI